MGNKLLSGSRGKGVPAWKESTVYSPLWECIYSTMGIQTALNFSSCMSSLAHPWQWGDGAQLVSAVLVKLAASWVSRPLLRADRLMGIADFSIITPRLYRTDRRGCLCNDIACQRRCHGLGCLAKVISKLFADRLWRSWKSQSLITTFAKFQEPLLSIGNSLSTWSTFKAC